MHPRVWTDQSAAAYAQSTTRLEMHDAEPDTANCSAYWYTKAVAHELNSHFQKIPVQEHVTMEKVTSTKRCHRNLFERCVVTGERERHTC